jgi:hypothetical protein
VGCEEEERDRSVEGGEATAAARGEESECGFGGRLLSNSDWSRPARAHLVSLSLSLSRRPGR